MKKLSKKILSDEEYLNLKNSNITSSFTMGQVSRKYLITSPNHKEEIKCVCTQNCPPIYKKL